MTLPLYMATQSIKDALKQWVTASTLKVALIVVHVHAIFD